MEKEVARDQSRFLRNDQPVNRSVVVLGGGLSGIAAATALSRGGCKKITIVEQGRALGGLAGTFEQEGHFYPLAYHHILDRDRPLLYFLNEIGALSKVRWRRVRMLFHLENQLYDLTRPGGFLNFPMRFSDKLRFAGLMMRSFRKSDWSDWNGRTARDLIDSWASEGVRSAIFEKLSRLKFGLPCREVSASWLGARLHFREGSAPFGFIPGSNWTKELCDGLTKLVADEGVELRLGATAHALHSRDGRVTELELVGGDRLGADIFVSTLPTETYMGLVPTDCSPYLEKVRYTAVISAICTTRQRIEPDFYWMNMLSLEQNSCGLFCLSSLNPSIGAPGETCLNFVTHVPSRHDDFFHRSDKALWNGYRSDFRGIFGFDLEPDWTHLTKMPKYSPILVPEYRNPPIRSHSWENVYFAGNYRTFPSTVTTGTALYSGLEAGQAVLHDLGIDFDVLQPTRDFRLTAMPRA